MGWARTLALLALITASPVWASDTPTPAAEEMSAAEVLDRWDDDGNGRITCAEARRHDIAPVPRGHPAYPFMRDADSDGVVCERS